MLLLGYPPMSDRPSIDLSVEIMKECRALHESSTDFTSFAQRLGVSIEQVIVELRALRSQANALESRIKALERLNR